MPRPSSSFVPKYRKHRGSGQAIVTLGGRDYYLGPYGTKVSHREYDRLIAEWLATGRSPSFGASGEELSISELLVDYLRYAKKYYGEGSKSEFFHYRRVARPLRELYGRTAAIDFGPLQFKAVRQKIVGEGCSRRFVNACMGRIARIFRWGAGEGMVPASVPQALGMVDGLRRGKTEAPETAPILPIDESTVDATLPMMPAIPADMVRLQRLTGMRPAEVCQLRPCDVDRSGDVWKYTPRKHKTQHHGHKRDIFIGPKAQAVLLRYLARDSSAYCFRPCDSEAKRLVEQEANRKTPRSCGNVRGSNVKKKPKRKAGERYETDSYRRAIHRACDKAGVPRWSPNRLRHSAATEIRKRFGLEAAQVTLGHASADITQVYAERDNTLAIEVAAKIG